MKKTSLSDIAEKLGVSKTLVSLVLNDRGPENGIKEETIEKVFEMAERLNYKPNQLARGLRMGKSNTLGLIVSDISNDFFSKIGRIIEDTANKHGYNVIFCSSDDDPKKEEQLIQILRNKQVDGIILSPSPGNKETILELKKEGLPIVLIDRFFPRINTNYVVVDNYKGAYEAVSHLASMNYTSIALIGFTPAHSGMKLRHEGYKAALKDHDISYKSKLVREVPFNDMERMLEEMKDLLQAPNSVRAILFANNRLAAAGLECLIKLKFRVPMDVAVVSFDDHDFFTLCYPPVTAVAQPREEIAREAVRILVSEIEDPNSNQREKEQVVLPVKLVIRKSCGV
jgi:LacI family transcriptional regulator